MTRLNVSVRGTKQYAKTLFRKYTHDRTLRVMRERKSGRITGIRTSDGRVIYRPKGGRQGVIANVEVVIDDNLRVNIHVRP